MKIGVSPSFTIGLVQINSSFSGQNYLPYSIGLLQSFVKKHSVTPERFDFLAAIYRRMPISSIVEHLRDADIIGISSYVWNAKISLAIAKRLKTLNPEILIIFGGPQVPDQPDVFMRENPFIDLCVHNEGERKFLHILETYPSRNWSEIDGLSYTDDKGICIRNPDAARFRDLDDVPSPFLDGTFDDLIRENPKEKWIGLWETNRGCPFQCSFCDWGSATASKVTKFGMDRLKGEVDWFARNKVEYIFCCDANFGIQKRDVEIAEYVAQIKSDSGYPHALSVQNTKNATERAYLTQKILSDTGLNKGVALSMQSVDMGTLEAIRRQNISLDTYMELQRRFTRDRVETYSDLILGLPNETYETFVNGVNMLMENGQHNRIQFNNLSILPNAEMGNPEYQKKYGMVTVVSEIINIHGERIQLDDDVTEEQDLVIATTSMPLEDWRRTRAFCWMVALLHFDKLFQIPLMVAHEVTGLSYREMIEAFMDAKGDAYPLIGRIRDMFLREAEAIQNGGPEYVFSDEWLGIYWPADEYIFVKLTADNEFAAFYAEAATLLKELTARSATSQQQDLVDEAVTVNSALVRQPFLSDDLTLETRHDLMGFYDAVRNGEHAIPESRPTTITIDRSSQIHDDFQSWCREVVWWGNKKGAYLYTNKVSEKQLAGHY